MGRVKHTFQLVMASLLGIGLSLASVIEWSNDFVDLGPAASGRRGVFRMGNPNITLIIVTREAADNKPVVAVVHANIRVKAAQWQWSLNIGWQIDDFQFQNWADSPVGGQAHVTTSPTNSSSSEAP